MTAGLLSGLLEARSPYHPDFNFKFLIFLIVCGLLAIFFLLYFNRLFASIVSYVIRTYTWHRYRVYIDIRALQISLLGGRIFFTGLRYHGSNETLLVQHGDITWQYWLRRVRRSAIHSSSSAGEDPGDDQARNAALPCRINVTLVGLEWFVYNRSSAYDAVLAGLASDASSSAETTARAGRPFDEKEDAELRPRRSTQNDRRRDSRPHLADGDRLTVSSSEPSSSSSSSTSRTGSDSNSLSGEAAGRHEDPKLPFLLQLFPIRIDCHKPALVLGNDNTRAILVIKADSASADVDASETKTSDPYRQLFKVSLQHPVVELKENEDFREDQAARATRLRGSAHSIDPHPHRSFFRSRRRALFTSLRNMVPYWRRSVESFSTSSRAALDSAASRLPESDRWKGLPRYLDDQHRDEKAWWSSVEYAAISTIIDSPEVVLTVYWDVVGRVTEHAARRGSTHTYSNPNGSHPPLWGINICFRGGKVNYGPWADRQRADLQRVFFPALARDASPSQPLPVGAWRVTTQFKLFVELEEAVTIRVPVREESKNWRWRGKEAVIQAQPGSSRRNRRNRIKKQRGEQTSQPRPPGWFEVKLPANTTASLVTDLLATTTGYENRLIVELPGSEMSSSVNHDLLWKSGAQRISCDLSAPLCWNTLRSWIFDLDCRLMEIYLLRDHLFLISDLVEDWASGPSADYLEFTPFKYILRLSLRDLHLYLNVNENNIIDKATSHDDNSYLVLSSPLLSAETSIALDKFRPRSNEIPFEILARTFNLTLHAPKSSPLAAFLPSDSIGHAERLLVSGSYHYYAATSPANTDTLVLNVHGKSPSAYLYGFLFRHVLILKDNYFGEHIHFRTLIEYQESLRSGGQHPSTEAPSRPPSTESNDFDVILAIKADDPRIMIPANLYSAGRFVQCEVADLSIDLRFTNYYMDLELDLSPIEISLGSQGTPPESPGLSYANTQLFVDGVRLFGHRAFGLPPSEPTYFCNWDICVGAATGDCSADLLASLARGAAALGFTFNDVENALVPYSSLVFYDVTFLRMRVDAVRLSISAGDAVFLLSTDAIDVGGNDWACSHYSKRTNINISNIQLSCVDADSASGHKSRPRDHVMTEAHVQMDVRLAVIERSPRFTEGRMRQQQLLRREDQRTGRTQYLLLNDLESDFVPEQVCAPAQCSPLPPYPLTNADEAKESISRHDHLSRPSFSTLASSVSSCSGSGGSLIRHRGRRRRADMKLSDADAQPSPHKAGGSLRSSLDVMWRKPSDSTSLHSAIHSTVDEHASVAFTSQYLAPHFLLEDVRPDTRDADFSSSEKVDTDEENRAWNTPRTLDLSSVNTDDFNEEKAHTSLLIEFPSGISAFANPKAIKHASMLLERLQPSEPEDILDGLQADVARQISAAQEQEDLGGRTKDLLVKLPKANIRFLNSSTPSSSDTALAEQDQYDLQVSRIALIARSVSEGGDEGNSSRTSFHFRLRSAEVSASERLSSLESPEAAILVRIDDVVVSRGAKDITYLDADVGSVVGTTASNKVEYLASLIHRTGLIASRLERLLAETLDRRKDRLKYLVFFLLQHSQSIHDPAFLIRPSAVLRSAHQHLRTFDSWKLMMRLRAIWSGLSSLERSQLMKACRNLSFNVPPDASKLVVSAFEKWRSWDLHDIPNALLLHMVFENLKTATAEKASKHTFMSACRLGEIRIVLDPGPKQNDMGVHNLNLRAEKKSTDLEEVLQDVAAFDGPLTTLNVYCSEATAHLNWELCELASDVARLLARDQGLINLGRKTESPLETSWKSASVFHVVIEVAKGLLELETANLSGNLLAEGMKMSTLVCANGDGTDQSSFLMNCTTVESEFRNDTQVITTMQLQQPIVFVSLERHDSTGAKVNMIKSTVSSQELSFVVEQDPIILLEVLDLVIKDEVAQLVRLGGQLTATTQQPEAVSKDKSGAPKVRINVAMLLDTYTFSLPLLPSLTYKIRGGVARASLSAVSDSAEVVFDFDIQENFHEMQARAHEEPKRISLVEIPPASGRVTSRLRGSNRILTVASSMEIIRFDASAIYSLLMALDRKHMFQLVQEVKEQVKAIRGHMKGIFDPDRPDKAPEEGAKLMYDIALALAGLQVLAKTSLSSNSGPNAQILFLLENLSLRASNQDDTHATVLSYPWLRANFQQIGLDISQYGNDAVKSCGSVAASVTVSASPKPEEDGQENWHFDFVGDFLDVNLFPETISTAIDVIGYLRAKMKILDTARELEYLRKLRPSRPRVAINDQEEPLDGADVLDSVLTSAVYNFALRNIGICWSVTAVSATQTSNQEDLVLSIKLVEFGTRTRKSARLTIESFQLQTVAPGCDRSVRSPHSALLPEVIFNVAYVSTASTRRMAFQATGESLDLRLTPGFIGPAANLAESISLSMKKVQKASAQWTAGPTTPSDAGEATPSVERPRRTSKKKRMETLLMHADFAGAVVFVSSKSAGGGGGGGHGARYSRPTLAGKYGQFTADDSGSAAVLRSPGLAWKAEYRDNGTDNPSLSGEVRIDASTNILYPSVVPIILDIISSVKEAVSDGDATGTDGADVLERPKSTKPEKAIEEDSLLRADPSIVLGGLRLNIGLRICRQAFSLSCQPIARVAATACFDNIYFTINTVTSQEHGNFFAISGTLLSPQASVQHVYSRDSTASVSVERVTLSFMNSKHVSGTSGVSAILKVSPMKVSINAKQVQDFLLFREIWYPEELRRASMATPAPRTETELSQAHLVQRYQQVAATTAFPWTATISITALDVDIDLGQAIGKSVFRISNFWVSSKKRSDWEQNLCLGFDKIGVESTGRMSGFIALQRFRLRTSIRWPRREEALNETPMVQASLAFNALRIKASFDYQAFLVADVRSLEFLMYNVRDRDGGGGGDRLVAVFDGEAVQVFGTTTSIAQGVALYQAVQKLMLERRDNFKSSLWEIEKFRRRKSSATRAVSQPPAGRPTGAKKGGNEATAKLPISLDTDVVVTLKTLNLGVFPSSFSDNQVFKMEALNAFARFAASIEEQHVLHSTLRMTLGEHRIGLAEVRSSGGPRTVKEMGVEDVVQRSTGSRGGTILKVPRVEATMQTWQRPDSNRIDYLFRSAFEGKVEVGWNYSRISYIRGMWANHSKALEQTWGRQLPLGAVKITGVASAKGEGEQQQKIRAEVKVPQWRYEYRALEPAVIETPQLREMGEATPPLEWIGLNREKLPNLTHQVVIVPLLELAGEVEDAYSRILGSS